MTEVLQKLVRVGAELFNRGFEKYKFGRGSVTCTKYYRPFYGFSNFSHRPVQGKIHQHHWKEHLKISEVAKFEGDRMKTNKGTTPQSCKIYRHLYGGGQVCAPHQTNVCKILRLFRAISLLFSDMSLSNWASLLNLRSPC